ncbi:unnamed protein product, partial [Vitis vinifera]
MGIESVAFCPCGPGTLALVFDIPRLIEAGHVNGIDGSLLNEELICLAKDIPAFSSNRLPWGCPSDLTVQEILFRLALQCIPAKNLSNWLLCNSVYELDSSACDLIPNILPIGPLLASNHLGHYTGNFWPEDSTCIGWLDKQPAGSVIYVAFGSLAILSQNQFNELALGIELVGRPFLWVVRSDFTNGSAAEYPDGFIERVAEHGKIVSWAPQEKVHELNPTHSSCCPTLIKYILRKLGTEIVETNHDKNFIDDVLFVVPSNNYYVGINSLIF